MLGVESPVGESVMLRAGYGWMSNPVPSATLLPLTAAIMQQSVGLGGGWGRGRLRVDGAPDIRCSCLRPKASGKEFDSGGGV